MTNKNKKNIYIYFIDLFTKIFINCVPMCCLVDVHLSFLSIFFNESICQSIYLSINLSIFRKDMCSGNSLPQEL